MDSRPIASVVIPVYNVERYLAEAIESVFAQTRATLEIVVVDDGSTDGSRAVAEGYARRVRVVSQAHKGIGAARNRGLEEVRGEYVAFLDADDVWEPRKIELQLAAIESDPLLDIVFGHLENFVSPEVVETGADALRHEGPMPASVASAALVSRSAFERVGVFPTDRAVGEFLDWHLRAREAGLRELMLPDVVARRRVHRDNSTFRLRDRRGEYASILKASLDRRRAE